MVTLAHINVKTQWLYIPFFPPVRWWVYWTRVECPISRKATTPSPPWPAAWSPPVVASVWITSRAWRGWPAFPPCRHCRHCPAPSPTAPPPTTLRATPWTTWRPTSMASTDKVRSICFFILSFLAPEILTNTMWGRQGVLSVGFNCLDCDWILDCLVHCRVSCHQGEHSSCSWWPFALGEYLPVRRGVASLCITVTLMVKIGLQTKLRLTARVSAVFCHCMITAAASSNFGPKGVNQSGSSTDLVATLSVATVQRASPHARLRRVSDICFNIQKQKMSNEISRSSISKWSKLKKKKKSRQHRWK